ERDHLLALLHLHGKLKSFFRIRATFQQVLGNIRPVLHHHNLQHRLPACLRRFVDIHAVIQKEIDDIPVVKLLHHGGIQKRGIPPRRGGGGHVDKRVSFSAVKVGTLFNSLCQEVEVFF